MTLTTEAPQAPVAAPAKTVADILEHAALIIEERGWCQNTYFSPEGFVCVEEAICFAATGQDSGDGFDFLTDPRVSEPVLRFAQWVDPADPFSFEPGYGALPDATEWNDKPGRTVDEVTAALRAAAAANR